MQQCPHCGDRAVLESYEMWTKSDGWRRLERLSCLNTKQRDPELRCGKVTVVSDTRIDRDVTPKVEPSRAPAAGASRSSYVRRDKTRRDSSASAKSAMEKPTEAPELLDDVEDTPEVPEVLELAPETDDSDQPEPTSDKVTVPMYPPADTAASTRVAEQPEPDAQTEPGLAISLDSAARLVKYSAEQHSRLISLIEGGMTCPQAAAEVGIQKNTAYGIIGKYRRALRAEDKKRHDPGLLQPGRAWEQSIAPPRESSDLRGSDEGTAMSKPALTLVSTSPPTADAQPSGTSVLSQMLAAGLSAHGRLLSSSDLASFFALSAEVQDRIRAFFELPAEAREALSQLIPVEAA